MEINGLRTKLRERDIEYRVVKNTLVHLAAEAAGKQKLDEFLQGPTAIAFGYSDITETAKALVEYIRSESNALSIKGGVMGDQSLSADQIIALATLPSRDELITQVVRGMQSPIYAFYHILSSQLSGLMTVLNRRLSQL